MSARASIMDERQYRPATINLPVSMILGIREGRYAVSPDGTNKLTFLRISEEQPKRGKRPNPMFGWRKIQTQHSDDYILRWHVHPNGQMRHYSGNVDSMTEALTLVIADPYGAAILYGQEKGVCCRCGKQLTDDRSRWYGIGPECEKLVPYLIGAVEEQKGPYVPGTLLGTESTLQ